jgi:hypothetical protein
MNIRVTKVVTAVEQCQVKSRKTPFLFFSNEGDGGGTFRLHFWNLHKIWI